MLLAFDSPLFPEALQLSQVSIPRYGCLTVNEILFLESLQDSLLGELQSTGVEGDRLLQALLTSLLLTSRVGTTWTLERVQSTLSAEEILAASLFFLEEKERWSEARERRKPKGNSKAIDWTDLFWQLKRLYPSEPRFSAKRIGQCPITLIEGALRAAQEQEIERLSSENRAIANLGVFLAAVHGAKNPISRWFNDFEAFLFQQRAIEEIPPEVAVSFMHLYKGGKVPEWVCEIADLDLIRASAAAIDRD